MPLQRLRSPFHLSDSPPPAFTPVSSRTRSKTPSTSARRRRFQFDELPWISTLDAPPEHTNPWDIADLSLIPLTDSDPLSSTGPGPVRRRKTSLRSCPISSLKNHSPGSSPPRDSIIPPPPSDSVTTPPSRFLPSRVLFHNLMPVVDFHTEHSRPCITNSRMNF